MIKMVLPLSAKAGNSLDSKKKLGKVIKDACTPASLIPSLLFALVSSSLSQFLSPLSVPRKPDYISTTSYTILNTYICILSRTKLQSLELHIFADGGSNTLLLTFGIAPCMRAIRTTHDMWNISCT